MKRPNVTTQTLKVKIVEGNLMHWAHYLKEDFDRFVSEYRDLMAASQKIAVIDVTDFLLRVLEDDAAKDVALGRTDDDRVVHYLNVAINVLNADTVDDAIALL